MTADGFIAKNAHHLASWTSKEDKKFFVQKTKAAGVMIMGANTYETIGKPMPGRLTIVYSRSKQYEGVEVTSLPPAELLASLKARGHTEVAICGGASIYTMFMKAGVVDTLFLSVEPLLFGTGVSIFNEQLEQNLQLISSTKLSDSVLLLEYSCR